ncbi:MAG TPA: diacylglycerol kinase family protein [Rhodopila sp.]|jgi:diacylglycerol kinase (ATP)|nr:diacylglycerol kinase family protein [Rhodopila sp.]
MLIVFNPVAGRRRAHLLWRVLDVLVANGVRLDLAETHRAGHAEVLAREAARRGEEMVVAAGGDGTIAEVANGVMGSATRLGVIPLGTANVLAHELGLPFAPRAVAAALAFGRTCRLWPGLAYGPEGARLFVQMLGVGFDAHVVHNLPFPLKKAFGKGAYVMQSMRELARYRFPPIRMRIDDTETEAASVIISKGQLYGGSFRVAVDAVPNDPGFSVVLFDRAGPGAAMMYGAALPLNLLSRAPGVRHVRARRIEFLQHMAVPAQTDGDRAGSAPLWVGDAAGPIQVVMG